MYLMIVFRSNLFSFMAGAPYIYSLLINFFISIFFCAKLQQWQMGAAVNFRCPSPMRDLSNELE
jgi:hypothetical protein